MEINTLLSKDDFSTLCDNQELLDSNIRQSHNISEDDWLTVLNINHLLALRVEIAEFINEAHDAWKYWKKKPVDKQKIIDEAVDIIHFAVLHLNKNIDDSTPETYAEALIQVKPHPGIHRGQMKEVLLTLSLDRPDAFSSQHLSDYVLYVVGLVLQVLDVYEFTTADILEAYQNKNAENFKRIADGY